MSGPAPVRTRRWKQRNRGPEMLAREVAFLAAQTGEGNGALPLQKPDHGRYRVLGWNRDTHMHVIWHQVALKNLALFLASQRVEDRTQVPTRLAEDGSPTSLGYEDHVVLAVPF